MNLQQLECNQYLLFTNYMGCIRSTPNQSKAQLYKQGDTKLLEKLSDINFKPLINNLGQKYTKILQDIPTSVCETSYDELLQKIRDIYMGLIKQNISSVNEGKINMKQFKVSLARSILQVQITVMKYVELLAEPQVFQFFIKSIGEQLKKLMRFLKTLYPRNQSLQGGQLIQLFKEFDYTEEFEFDMMANAKICFTQSDLFSITNTIKQFFNIIIEELDKKYLSFQALVEAIAEKDEISDNDKNHNFKVSRKISENTSKFFKFDTGTIQNKSTQIARVLVKWLEDLQDTLTKAEKRINPKNQYKFYKEDLEYQAYSFKRCDQVSFQKRINEGLKKKLQDRAQKYKAKQKKINDQYRKFNTNLVKLLNNGKPQQSQVSKQFTEVIKFCSYNNSFISWMVQQKIYHAIKCILSVTKPLKQARGVLDLIKFKINDLLRCQIMGSRKTLVRAYNKLKQLQENQIISIVKIKNRLQTPLSDAMISFKMKDSFIICQCQLVLSDEAVAVDKKAKNIETLNHFLFQFERSPFGFLGQIATFLTANSQTISSYGGDKIEMKMVSSEYLKIINQCKIKCLKINSQKPQTNQQAIYEQNKLPFICSICAKYFGKHSNKIKISKCNKCLTYFCNQCLKKNFDIKSKHLIKQVQQKLETQQEARIQKIKVKKQLSLNTKSPIQGAPSYLINYMINIVDNKNTEKKSSSKIKIIENDQSLTRIKGQQQSLGRKLLSKILLNFQQNQKNLLQKFLQKKAIKDNYLKVNSIIQEIRQNTDFNIFIKQYDYSIHFVIATWKQDKVVFKCYRYDHNNNNIVNVYKEIQKYENHEFIEINPFDKLFWFNDDLKYAQFNQLLQIQQNEKIEDQQGKSQVQLKTPEQRKKKYKNQVKHILQNGIYIFEGQSQDKFIRIFQKIKQRQRDEYFLVYFSLNTGSQQQLYLVVGYYHSIKQINRQQKVKLSLQKINMKQQLRKNLQLQNMNIYNKQLADLNKNLNFFTWIQQITIIDLSRNNLSSIQVILRTCYRAKKIDISNNQFTQLQFPVKLNYIKNLNAEENSIKRIKNVGNILSLQYLNLKSNKLKYLVSQEEKQIKKKSRQNAEKVKSQTIYRSNQQISTLQNAQKVQSQQIKITNGKTRKLDKIIKLTTVDYDQQKFVQQNAFQKINPNIFSSKIKKEQQKQENQSLILSTAKKIKQSKNQKGSKVQQKFLSKLQNNLNESVLLKNIQKGSNINSDWADFGFWQTITYYALQFCEMTFFYLLQLNIQSNEFQDLSQFEYINRIEHYPFLTSLNVCNNLLSRLPKLKLKKLQSIRVSDNFISQLQQFQMQSYPNLIELVVKNNRIHKLQELKCRKLIKLDLSYNRELDIKNFLSNILQEDIESIKRIRYLCLSKINFKNFPKLSLKQFTYENSDLTDQELPQLLEKITYFQKIEAQSDKLPQTEENSKPKRKQHSTLKTLSLSKNKLKKLPDISFLFELDKLYLDQNPIGDLTILDRQIQNRDKQKNTLQQKDALSNKIKPGKQDKSQKKDLKLIPQDKNSQPQKRQYSKLKILWISLNYTHENQFQTQRQKFHYTMGQDYHQRNLVCWKYNQHKKRKSQEQKFNINEKSLNHNNIKNKINLQLQKQILSLDIPVQNFSPPPRKYLKSLFYYQETINERFKQVSTYGLYELEHQCFSVNMDDFLKYNWDNLMKVNFQNCSFSDIKWKKFVKSHLQFSQLESIQIKNNKIQNVNIQDLQSFQLLKEIDFGEQKGQTNPLSPETKQMFNLYNKKFKISIKYENESERRIKIVYDA